MTVMSEEQVHDRDALHRGIGRFIVSFSQLVYNMESGIVGMAGIGRGQAAIEAWQIGLTGIEADRMRILFFGVAGDCLDFTPEEKRVRDALNKAVLKLIPLRNAFAHGTWFLGSATGGSNVTFKEAYVAYSKLHPDTGTVRKDEKYTAAQLEALCDEIDELTGLLGTFSMGCTDAGRVPRVGDRLELVNGKVSVRNVEGWTPPDGGAN